MQLELYRATNARDLRERIERAIAQGRLQPGQQLPTVRVLARHLGLSPATVAAAYRDLGRRGVLHADGRRGTRVRPRPPLPLPAAPSPPPGVADLSTGLPDPALLPSLEPALTAVARRTGAGGRLERGNHAALLELARSAFAADGIEVSELAVVGGALDGIERVLAAYLRVGDRVAVEDPGFPPLLDLVAAMGLDACPVALDDEGPLPESLSSALHAGARALLLTPRAQNPSGAALTPPRVRELRGLLAEHSDLLVIEDDHAGPVAGAAALTLTGVARHRWAIVRSVSKWLSPDLRVGLLAADARTLDRVEGRQRLGTGWVSGIIQATVAELWRDPDVHRAGERAAASYGERRQVLVDALAGHGIEAHGASGLNVWVPVGDEHAVSRALLDRGWQVAPGARHRLAAGPAIRVTVAAMSPLDAAPIAAAIAAAQRGGRNARSY
jgi:DNA-binding transcriptional MocR family regulator